MTSILRRFLLIVGFFFITGFAPIAWAYQQAYIPGHDINFSTGNKYLGQNDIAVDGPVSPFSFSRHYNSQSSEDGILGYGWSFSWNENLAVYPDLDLAVYTRADGKMVHFTYNGTDWVNDVWKKGRIKANDAAPGYILTRPDGTLDFFDGDGRLIEKRDLNQNSVYLTYDLGSLTQIADGFGRTLTFTYGENTKVERIDSPVGSHTFAYDARNNLVSVTRPDGGVRHYLYEDTLDIHNLTGVIDETGAPTQTIGYDSLDRVISSSLTGGSRAVSISYQSGYKRVITDSLGAATTYKLEMRHGVAQVVEVDGPGCASCGSDSDTQYTYNHRQQVSSITDGRGNTTLFTYDDQGNKLTEIRAAGTPQAICLTYTYDPVSNKVKTITRPSVVDSGQTSLVTMNYDTGGNLVSRTESGLTGSGTLDRTHVYTYDTLGRLTSVNGPRTDVNDLTTMAYYPNTADQGLNRGFLKQVTNSLGHTRIYGNYNCFGRPGTITDANGLVTHQTYDGAGRLVSSTTGALETLYAYDPAGRLLSVTLPDARIIRYTYDAAGQMASVADTLGNSIGYTYDSEGRKTKQTIKDPTGSLTAYMDYAYDQSGRLEKIIYPDEQEEIFAYDGGDNLVSRTGRTGIDKTFAYDPLNRLTRITEPGEAVTGFTYDLHGNQTGVTDAEGRATIFAFDDFGNRISRVSPDTGTTSYAYDAGGNPIEKTDANGTTTQYAYDALNRLTSVSFPDDDLNISYTWDQGENGLGRLTAVSDETGTTAYAYNAYGSLVREVRTIKDIQFQTAYGYNLNQEITSVTYPGGRVVAYIRDDAGQVTGVTSTFNGKTIVLAEDLSYLPFGPSTAMSLGNGLTITKNYDPQYRLTSDSAGTIHDRSYAYLADGRISAITDGLDPSRSQTFEYDDLSRLTRATGAYGQIDYTYDSTGNRLTRTKDQDTLAYTYQEGASRLTGITGSQTLDYTYDGAGNPLTKGERVFTWSKANRLGQIEVNAEEIARYGYDARGLRTLKTTAQGIEIFLYDARGNLLAEADGTGTLVREYVYLNNRRLTLFDHGRPRELTVSVSTSSEELPQGVSVYAFNEAGSYTGISAATDAEGRAFFSRSDFGPGTYKFRIDYLGAQFWSESVNVQETGELSVLIETKTTGITVALAGTPKQGVKVYAFTAEGIYLGLYAVTDDQGSAFFDLPLGEAYAFRADLYGSQYWSENTIIGPGSSPAIDTGGGSLEFTLSKGKDLPMAGITTYLFSSSGTYLGRSAVTDGQGTVCYEVPAGTYKIRSDYLGYQYMGDPVTVTEDTGAGLVIAHKEIQVTVTGKGLAGTSPLGGIPCYLFTPEGGDQGITAITDDTGTALFTLPEKPYKIRADYLDGQYWSAGARWQNAAITIDRGRAVVGVTRMDEPVIDVPVHVFDAAGTNLGCTASTDSRGEAFFDLPAGTYRFRADYQGSRYWGNDLALVPYGDNPVKISAGGGGFELSLTTGALPMEGVRTYIFTESGTYFGEYANTDNEGRVSFNLPAGSYKARMDYLGYPYWTDAFTLPDDTRLTHTIPHREVLLMALLEYGDATGPVQTARAHVLTPGGRDVNINAVTDRVGQAVFTLPEQPYKIRLDYLGRRYYSDAFTGDAVPLILAQGRARVSLTGTTGGLPGIPVRLSPGSADGPTITHTTGEDGSALFQVPEGYYIFRADYPAGRYRASGRVSAGTTREISLGTGGGSLALTLRSPESRVIPGVNCHLFTASGTGPVQSAVTDHTGLVVFKASDGSYKVRTDYLGYQYWSDILEIPADLSASILIDHRDIKVSVVQDRADGQSFLPGVNCHLFTEEGGTGITVPTDEEGHAHFTLPDRPYKIRADYMDGQYWSEPLNWADTTIAIAHGDISLQVSYDGSPASGLTACLFNESGTYLGLSAATGEDGMVRFTLPRGSYRIRVDRNGEQFWTPALNILPHQDNEFELELTDPDLAVNAPRPKRWDGNPPMGLPLFASIGALPLDALTITTATEISDEPRPFWYIDDHLGTAQAVTDIYGRVVWQGHYLPFGGDGSSGNMEENRFRFPGQYFDAETGLHYNWHRYFDPETGRYLTPDPIGLAGGINLFAYSDNNPINRIDPFGLYNLPFPWNIVEAAKDLLEQKKALDKLQRQREKAIERLKNFDEDREQIKQDFYKRLDDCDYHYRNDECARLDCRDDAWETYIDDMHEWVWDPYDEFRRKYENDPLVKPYL